VTKDTLFQVGSVSKPVAAWAFMHLVQDGKLELDTPMSQYLTRWQIPASEYDINGVTLRRLLSHTAGLSLHGYAGFAPDVKLPSTVASLSGDTNGSGAVFLQSEPGTQWSYSGGGYTLMQLLVDEVAGMAFSDYVLEHVFLPLDMDHSTYYPTDEQLANTAQAHDFHFGVLPNFRFAAEAAAALHSTAEDLAKFAVANMSDNTVLTTDTVVVMHTAVEGTDVKWGLGFSLHADGKAVGHDGSNIGWKALLRFVPESGKGIVILTNAESGARMFNETQCYWDRAFEVNLFKTACLEVEAQVRKTSAIMLAISALFLLAVLLVGALIYRRHSKLEYRFRLVPLRPMRTVLLILLVFGLLAWFLFWHTTAGVYLIAGFPFSTAADHMPADFRYISSAVILLLAMLCTLVILRKDTPRVRQ